ncbi:MAG: methylase [Methanosarcinaceae archaeon]|nr:methylase [Methanosarcinaceae archaeon]
MVDSEKIIKSKKRVQMHGEVLTPKKVVRKMLDTPDIRDLSKDLETTFLEPGAGEGAFLSEILERKLKTVHKMYCESIIQYENYSLFALSTLYGVEYLEDNTTACVLNLYDIFYKYYKSASEKFNRKIKNKILDCAKIIIKSNIVQGDFLTKKTAKGKYLIFSEWKPVNLYKGRTITVNRTEYTLDEIIEKKEKEPGEYISGYYRKYGRLPQDNQSSIFDFDNFENPDESETVEVKYRYKTCKITDVHLELMEELYE